jgi:predicted phage tail protein
LEEYNLLVIAPKLEGGVSAIAAGILAAFGTTAAASTAAAVAAYAAAVIITVGIIVALGYLMQALSPNKKLDGNTDPSEASRIFNGVPNITEQGGSVPVVIGNCLFGGVRIGLKFEVALNSYADTRTVASFTEAMAYPSSWLKIV